MLVLTNDWSDIALLNAFTLKLIAMALMTLDHIAAYIPGTPIWFGYLGRLSAPVFFYFSTEGFFYTSSRKKYILRLFYFAILMIGIDFVLGISNNIFLSLALGVCLMTAIDYGIKTKKFISAAPLALAAAFIMIFTEASFYGIFMVLVFYFFRGKKWLMAGAYAIISLAPILWALGAPSVFEQLFLFDYQWMMIFALPFLLIYNGERGIDTAFTKWLFYGFYPIHLILILTCSRFLF